MKARGPEIPTADQIARNCQGLSQRNLGEREIKDLRPSTSLVPQRLRLKKRDPSLAKRDAIIEAPRLFHGRDTCKTSTIAKLSDEINEWIPTSLTRKYAATTFLQAYRHQQLRKLVDKMISVKRHPRRYP